MLVVVCCWCCVAVMVFKRYVVVVLIVVCCGCVVGDVLVLCHVVACVAAVMLLLVCCCCFRAAVLVLWQIAVCVDAVCCVADRHSRQSVLLSLTLAVGRGPRPPRRRAGFRTCIRAHGMQEALDAELLTIDAEWPHLSAQ